MVSIGSIDMEALISELVDDEKERACNVYGRILKGQVSEHFETLTYCPHTRFLVMLMDSEGLGRMQNLPGLEALRKIGYPENYISEKLSEGYGFKLVVFEDGNRVKEGTWENVIKLACRAYPQWKEKLKRQLPVLKSLSYDQVKGLGSEPWEVRKFLDDVMNYNRLFTGDGFTRTEQGETGVKEYVMFNCRIEELNNYIIKDIRF